MKRDADRWRLVKACVDEYRLSDAAKLIAIQCIVNSREPYSERDIQRTRELAEQLGWKRKAD